MSNPLFKMLGGSSQQMQLLQQFNQFKSGFKGNPQLEVQRLMASGKISQAQYNNAVQMASQLQQLIR